MDLILYFREMWQLAIQGQAQGIWFWASTYLVIVCIYSLIFQIRTRFWPFVQGEIVKVEVDKFGGTDLVKSNQEYVSKALYTYNVSGVDYEGTRISPWVFVASHNARFVLEKQMSYIQVLPGGKVKVYYNPQNPKKSYLIVAGKAGICVTISLCVFPLVAFYLKYHA